MSDETRPSPTPAQIHGPFGRSPASTRRRVLWIAGAAALLLWVFLVYQDGQIKQSNGPGIVSFEVAGTEDHAKDILEDWGARGRDDAWVSLYVDFAYLIAYSVFLAVGCTIASERLRRRGMRRIADIGPLLGWAMFAAGLFDAIEDVALLRVLDGHTATWPGIALYAAIPKFAIAGIGLAYVVLGAVLGKGASGPGHRRVAPS